MCFGYVKAKEDFMQFCSSTLLSGIRIESKSRLLCSHCSTYAHTTCRKSLFEQNKTGKQEWDLKGKTNMEKGDDEEHKCD